jgi:hypothetical protein
MGGDGADLLMTVTKVSGKAGKQHFSDDMEIEDR